MNSKEKYARLKLFFVKGLGIKSFLEILENYSSVLEFISDYEKGKFFKKSYRRFNFANIPNIKNIQEDEFIVFGEESYPLALSNIADPPIVLFVRGDISLLHRDRMISVVGTRKYSEYGKNQTQKIVSDLISSDYTIVSGMAFGVDTVAHKAALDGNGKTIAVLGTPVDVPYPKDNLGLYKRILDNGLVISENYNNSNSKGIFARRNRIIAGLSSNTIVIEAPKRSGALITAHLAFDYSREVFALPGKVGDINSEGTNHLIKIERARILTDSSDIVGELPVNKSVKKLNPRILSLSDKQSALFDKLIEKRLNADQLSESIEIPINQVLIMLSQLELKGLVYKDTKGEYVVK